MFEQHEFIGEKGNKGTLANYEAWIDRHCKLVNSLIAAESGKPETDVFTEHHHSNSARLEQFLQPMKNRHINVVEVAAGPNFTTPYTLHENGYDFTYISCDIYPKLKKLNIRGVMETGIVGSVYHVFATASVLPLPDNSIDACVYLHAVNDIWYSEGMRGIHAALSESLRALKPGGVFISSDQQMDIDPTTNYVSHIDVKRFLDESCRYEFEEYDNEVPGRGWLVVHDIKEL
ncbi:methyltransferase domain-containing protein [Candidatus Poribacteria bacterium]